MDPEESKIMDNLDQEEYEFPKPDWAVSQSVRWETGLLEDICEHGIGHPNREWLAKYDPDGTKCFGIHGCDGCCRISREVNNG